MKRINYPTVLLIILFIASCQPNFEFTDQTFYGDLSGTGITAGPGLKNASVSFKTNSVFINGIPFPYAIIDDNEDNYLIRIQTGKNNTENIDLQYLKEEQELIILSIHDEKTTRLMTLEKMLETKLEFFSRVTLESDITHLSQNQKQMLKHLFEAADIMNELFWIEAWGDREKLMKSTDNQTLRDLYQINYGPWERLNNDEPFVEEFGKKAPGANFYPSDITVEEFENFDDPDKKSLYTLIRRDDEGKLKTIWYHEAFAEQIQKAAELLKEAAALADDQGFRHYLELRAEALLSDDYYESDVAWMQMKDNDIDFVVGPIENYEDKLFNFKAAHEAFILIKDRDWSEKLTKIAGLLPMLQRNLPVPARFRQESPGTSSDLNVYDVVYYAGDCNAGSKTIAINLPNDPEVRKNYGSRKLQLKNSIRYKFENILVPISNVLISEDQRKYIDFNSFFENTMFHEVAHGLGLDYTVNNKGPVRVALRDTYSAIEEGKADIIGLYIVTRLTEMGELNDSDLMNNYVTFMASIFRSVRFGAASAHGKANMIRFYYFQEKNAFKRDPVNGTYRIDFEKMKSAMIDLTNEIISIQGLGDYEKAQKMITEKGVVGDILQKDLDRLNALNIPVDLVFDQGPENIGL